MSKTSLIGSKPHKIRVFENLKPLLAKKQGLEKTPNPLILLVIVSGFEPLAYRLGAGSGS